MESKIKKNIRRNMNFRRKIKTFNKSIEDLIMFKHLKNNSDKLLIVFSSANKFDQTTNITHLNRNYSWYKNFSEESEFDVLFISDNLFQPYGWYCFSGVVSTIEYINRFITNFVEKHSYKQVYSFGTSKGGTGALLYGILNDSIDVIITGIPIIAVKDYIRQNANLHQHYEHFYREFLVSSETDKFNHIFDGVESNKPIYFITTEGDSHFRYQKKFLENTKITNMKIFLDIEKDGHGKAVINHALSIISFVKILIKSGNEVEIEGHIRRDYDWKY